MNRQQSAARQRPAMAPPPIQTVGQPPRANVLGETMNSPLVQPTPPSQLSSPSTTRSPGFSMQGMASPTADLQPRQQYPQQRQMRPLPHSTFQQQQQQQQQQQRAHNRSISTHAMGQPYSRRSMHIPASQAQANYYPTSFQKHYDQLGKSTPSHLFQFLSGGYVRPRLNPLVQTRSMTLKLTCLTTLTATTWIRTVSFPISGCRPNLEVVLEWEYKRLHQRLLPQQATQADSCPLCPSTMILCWMPTHLDCLHRCIFRILLGACHLKEGNFAMGALSSPPQRSGVFMSLFCICQEAIRQISGGVMEKLIVWRSWRSKILWKVSDTRKAANMLFYCISRLRSKCIDSSCSVGYQIENRPTSCLVVLHLVSMTKST